MPFPPVLARFPFPLLKRFLITAHFFLSCFGDLEISREGIFKYNLAVSFECILKAKLFWIQSLQMACLQRDRKTPTYTYIRLHKHPFVHSSKDAIRTMFIHDIKTHKNNFIDEQREQAIRAYVLAYSLCRQTIS